MSELVNPSKELIDLHLLAIMVATSDTEIYDVFVSLYKSGYNQGFSQALKERIESDTKALEFINNTK